MEQDLVFCRERDSIRMSLKAYLVYYLFVIIMVTVLIPMVFEHFTYAYLIQDVLSIFVFISIAATIMYILTTGVKKRKTLGFDTLFKMDSNWGKWLLVIWLGSGLVIEAVMLTLNGWTFFEIITKLFNTVLLIMLVFDSLELIRFKDPNPE